MPALDQPLRDSSAATDGLVITLTQQVVKPGAITLMAEPYRTAGTAALAKSFALWRNRAVVRLDQMLQRRIDGFAEQQNFVLVVTAVGLLLVTYLWVGFYVAVMRTVSRLDGAAQRMVSGDLDGRFTWTTATNWARWSPPLIPSPPRWSPPAPTARPSAGQRRRRHHHHRRRQPDHHLQPAAERIFGYTAAEVVGQPFARLLPDGALAAE